MQAPDDLRRPDGTPLGSDLARLDAIADGDIDTQDAPVPDLADWVRHARPFEICRGA